MATVAALKHSDVVSALDGYDPVEFYRELLGGDELPGRQIAQLWHSLETSELSALKGRATDAERELFKLGITFAFQSGLDAGGTRTAARRPERHGNARQRDRHRRRSTSR